MHSIFEGHTVKSAYLEFLCVFISGAISFRMSKKDVQISDYGLMID